MAFQGKTVSETALDFGDRENDSTDALNLILGAWDEGLESGIAPQLMAYAALFAAFSDLVAIYGEDAVIRLARGLEARVERGEFSLGRGTQDRVQ